MGIYMAYSGKYKVKHRSRYKGDADKVVYRSKWELYCFQWCDNNSEIKSWGSEEVVIPYLWEIDKKYHRYFMDLKVTYKSGKTVLIEIKPDKETRPPKKPDNPKTRRYINEATTYVKNMNKWSAAQAYALDRGWEFQIWTEHTLEKMGIMSKAKKMGLKPLKPVTKKYKPRKLPKKKV
tara:strand:+ start:146 stop:679 length:534 start_codon:yes stop_codon:yes gene_type:complete